MAPGRVRPCHDISHRRCLSVWVGLLLPFIAWVPRNPSNPPGIRPEGHLPRPWRVYVYANRFFKKNRESSRVHEYPLSPFGKPPLLTKPVGSPPQSDSPLRSFRIAPCTIIRVVVEDNVATIREQLLTYRPPFNLNSSRAHGLNIRRSDS